MSISKEVIRDGPLTMKFLVELRMGLELYEVFINGKKLKKRFSVKDYLSSDRQRGFLGEYLFSDDKRYLAISEHISYLIKDGYRTNLILIDLAEQKELEVSQVENGLIIPKKFEKNSSEIKIIYHKHTPKGFTREFELEISKQNKWKKL